MVKRDKIIILKKVLELIHEENNKSSNYSPKGAIPSGICYYVGQAAESLKDPELPIDWDWIMRFERWFYRQKPSPTKHSEHFIQCYWPDEDWWWPKGDPKPRIAFIEHLIRTLGE